MSLSKPCLTIYCMSWVLTSVNFDINVRLQLIIINILALFKKLNGGWHSSRSPSLNLSLGFYLYSFLYSSCINVGFFWTLWLPFTVQKQVEFVHT